MGKNILLLVRDIAVALAIILIVLFFIRPTIVFEHSMQSTLEPKDYVLLAKQAYTFSEIDRGDIVVFKSEIDDATSGGKKNLIKRVVAIPGDTIEIRDNLVILNGSELFEPYIKDGVTPGTIASLTIGEGQYFVMGDNRIVSKDSRDPDVGLVSEANIAGKVIFRLFPISSAGTL